ncbi:hypothetical protein Tco_0426020, partial [Tanacetum coccineum]
GCREDSMEYHDDLMDFVPPTPHDSPLSGGNTPGSDEGRMELIQELMETCTSLTKRVIALEEAKTTQDRGSGENGSSNADQVTSVPVNVSAATPSTPPTTTIFGDEDLTIAQTLMKMRNKGKCVLVGEEPEKPVKVKRRDQGLAQIKSDAELAQRLHEEELAEFDEIQARIDADHELVVRLTHEEQEKYTIEERARLLAEFFKRRKKQLATERAEAIRNKPPTRTQVRNMMITYLKHMDDDSQQQAESTKKRPRVDSEEESSKKQKLEEDNDAKKEELRDSIDVVSRDDVAIDVESLATKYLIVD